MFHFPKGEVCSKDAFETRLRVLTEGAAAKIHASSKMHQTRVRIRNVMADISAELL